MTPENILRQAAADFNIVRGETESAESFKARTIYSTICRLSYGSLWDKTNSVRHFTDKAAALLNAYLKLCPDVKISENLREEIYDLYLKNGYLYHESHHVRASIFSCAKLGEIVFLRGIPPTLKVSMSGAGFYADKSLDAQNFKTLADMFLLPEKSLVDTWQEIISAATWHAGNLPGDAEFLRMSPPFKNGYWQSKPNSDGKISLARAGLPGDKIYYLYKFDGENFQYSQIPSWQTGDEFFSEVLDYKNGRGGIYRQISCACLANYKVLPPINFRLDGEIIYAELGYLPPPQELYLWTLYSWAQNPAILPNNFKRIFAAEIFFTFKKVFEELGYRFSEVKS